MVYFYGFHVGKEKRSSHGSVMGNPDPGLKQNPPGEPKKTDKIRPENQPKHSDEMPLRSAATFSKLQVGIPGDPTEVEGGFFRYNSSSNIRIYNIYSK